MENLFSCFCKGKWVFTCSNSQNVPPLILTFSLAADEMFFDLTSRIFEIPPVVCPKFWTTKGGLITATPDIPLLKVFTQGDIPRTNGFRHPRAYRRLSVSELMLPEKYNFIHSTQYFSEYYIPQRYVSLSYRVILGAIQLE